MKALLVGLLFVILSMTAMAQQQGKYFFVKSGHIEYTLGGNTTGTKSVWFDNYGMLMYTLTESTTTVKILGIKSTTSTKELEIRKGSTIWKADLLQKTGSKMSIETQTEVGEKLTKGKTDAQLHEMERKVITDMGAEIEGYETFLGKNCLKFKWGTTKFLQYKGIPLKSQVSTLGVNYTETGTSFETNVIVPATKFEIPTSVKFEDMGEMMDMLQNGTN
jgi:hypothetical protein